jgi:methylenetetrahydrofolate dehydrogenase (NADP+)/methenyltetrahydrofolate cyclohydrolase
MHKCNILDGKAFAAKLYQELEADLELLKSKYNLTPGLAVILVGDDPASRIYVSNKVKKAKEVGINIFEYYFPESTSQKILIAKIEALNNDAKVHGILVQLPLPKHLDSYEIVNTINHMKDVDGFTVKNVGLLNTWQPCLEPSTPAGVLKLLKSIYNDNLTGKRVVIIGRSTIVGRPISSILLREDCTVTVLHSKSEDLVAEAKRADILISATGSPKMVKADWVRPGACVIDVGIVRVGDKIVGDVDFDEVSKVAGFITPVPGGIGPITVASMLTNTLKAACMQRKIDLLGDRKGQC